MDIVVPLQQTYTDVPTGSLEAETLLTLLLREQQTTAVTKFAQWHEKSAPPTQAKYYRDLIPLALPKEGEQFAFEVDLDACSGCKACVAACHNLNGLEEDETWRSVGLLHGGTSVLPVLQHVTTACHHCVEPQCLEGCPVNAYEKDPVTGIVRHLDDQCFGCQYCILKCPYDVPKFSPSKGIVRKCDMCRDRLAVGEAPACVQSCPHTAIRITVVNKKEIAENAEANMFLPGAPEPDYTLPSTTYKTRKPLPTNLLPADYYSASPQHAHVPLVVMLIFTQMSVGAFVVDEILFDVALVMGEGITAITRAAHLTAAFALGMIGLASSTFHLGRPWLAYRAVIGWRTSWLSREAIAFGGFAFFASVYASLPLLETLGIDIPVTYQRVAGGMVAASGLLSVVCSAMIYASTRRPFWTASYTAWKFLLTCFVLGIPVSLLIQLATVGGSGKEGLEQVMRGSGVVLCGALVVVSFLKLMTESLMLRWIFTRAFTPLKRTALLMTGVLRRLTIRRFLWGTGGGVVLPIVLLAQYSPLAKFIWHPFSAVAAAVSIFGMCLIGESLERYLFFRAVVAPKMPGAPAS